MMIIAGDLNMTSFGKTITARQGETTVSGVLCNVEHSADLIEDSPFGAVPSYVMGRSKTTVTVIPGVRLDLEPDALVEVSE